MRLRIEYIDAKRCHVVARQCEAGALDFQSFASLKLDEVPVQLGFQPRALTPEGKPDFTIWSFIPCVRTDVEKFRVGDTVLLTG